MRKTVLLLLLMTFLTGCEYTTGTALVTGSKRSPIEPDTVIIYDQLLQQDQYEVVGSVAAESPVAFSIKAAQDRAAKKLKQKAAEIGANGIMEIYIRNERKMINASGKAIYVYE